MLHHVGLFFHMAGIMLIGGGSIGAILAEKQLWKKISEHSQNARVLVPILQSATFFILAGMMIFLISGLALLYSVSWFFLKNPWFIAKLVCFALLPVRGALVGRPIIARINEELQADNYDISSLMKLKSKLKLFHIVQFILVAAIIFLVIFKV